ncbi:MAG: DUF3131 domain-containing protein [Candidatus Omnitrophica bacterium]|nr:DUF3131 domain-containing protein [Candidatus Omnitrophota bacterium]
MLARFKFLLFFSFFLSFVGCAAEAPVSVFTEIPTGKTTSSASRFELVDDFNAGLGRTRHGADWKTSETNGAKLKLFSDRDDAVKHGGSLRIEYELPPQASVRVFTALNGLDLSQADFVVLLIRRKELETFSGKFAQGLRDNTGKDAAVELRPSMKRLWQGPKSQWVEVAIPRSAFGALDFNQLERFEITLTASQNGAKGTLLLDEIAFFGPEEIVFKSDQDNLIGFPEKVVVEARRRELLAIKDDKEFLRQVGRDTWRYFEALVDRKTRLVVDHVRLGETGSNGVGSYTSLTNLALYWMANVAAMDLSLISNEEAKQNIKLSLASFEKLETWQRSFWYQFYHTGNSRVTRRYVSVADTGWLAASLVIVRQAFPEEFREKAAKILKRLNFSEFYDTNGQLKLGYDDDKKLFAPYHYGLLATEARLASYVAIGKGDLDKEHWARIYRTFPPDREWQKQVPEGKETELFGVPVFEGHYRYLGKRFVPSWGGSLFEFLAPTLVVNEQELAPKGLGKNNKVVTELHMEHALRKKGYPVWGMAPCAVRNGKHWVYREYGVPELGAKGYPDRGVIAPYATFLALATEPRAAVQNLREMLSRYADIYGEYGYYDSVDVLKGTVNQQYLALDQGMSFLAIANFAADGTIRNRFHSDPIGQKAAELLKEEEFSID